MVVTGERSNTTAAADERYVSSGANYARSRRILGAAYVGTIVALSSLALLTGAVTTLFGKSDLSPAEWCCNIFVFVFLFGVLALPFDLAGYWIDRESGRTADSVYDRLHLLSRASCTRGLLFLAICLVLSGAAQAAGLVGMSLAALVMSALMIANQTALAKMYSAIAFQKMDDEHISTLPLGRHKKPEVLTAWNHDAGFTGGVVGLPGAEQIVIPERWLLSFTRDELRTELTRRSAVISTGSRTRGVLLSIAFTVLGVLVCGSLTMSHFGLALETSAGLITMSLCFTLWSFLGLLTLPGMSHTAVLEADRLALEQGFSADLVKETISKIDTYLEDDSKQPNSGALNFRSIPSLSQRLSSLGDNSAKGGAWSCGRYAVVLSIIGLGLLGRAVHCNAGRPELWGFPPSD